MHYIRDPFFKLVVYMAMFDLCYVILIIDTTNIKCIICLIYYILTILMHILSITISNNFAHVII